MKEKIRKVDDVASKKMVSQLCDKLCDISAKLEVRKIRMQEKDDVAMLVGARLMLDDVMQYLYQNMREVIPYTRLGLALMEENGQTVRARWANSQSSAIKLGVGYTHQLRGSSLETISRSKKPRIINDLNKYLFEHPTSESTRLIYEEGIRSSFTCPLFSASAVVGFIFFSSDKPYTYSNLEVERFESFCEQLSEVIERARFISEIAEQKMMDREDGLIW